MSPPHTRGSTHALQDLRGKWSPPYTRGSSPAIRLSRIDPLAVCTSRPNVPRDRGDCSLLCVSLFPQCCTRRDRPSTLIPPSTWGLTAWRTSWGVHSTPHARGFAVLLGSAPSGPAPRYIGAAPDTSRRRPPFLCLRRGSAWRSHFANEMCSPRTSGDSPLYLVPRHKSASPPH